MEWIEAKHNLPNNHHEYVDSSITVLVSDGYNIGFGYYEYSLNRWTYTFPGQVEESNNNITHWAYPPKLPNR